MKGYVTMGLLDALKKIAGAAADIVEDVAAQANDALSSEEKKVTESANSAGTQNQASATLLATADRAAKPSVRRETTFFGTDDAEYDVSFLLSGDFIAFNSHCELEPSFQYEPDNDADYTAYEKGLPNIFCGPIKVAYQAAKQYLETKEECGREFAAINNGTFLFRTKLPYAGDVLYAYVFSPDAVMPLDVLGLTYPASVEGTPLEKKLIAALDEAAETYTETKKE